VGGTYLGYGEGGGSLTAITSLINVKAFFSEHYGGYNNGVIRITYNINSPITAYYSSNGYAFIFFQYGLKQVKAPKSWQNTQKKIFLLPDGGHITM